MDDLIDNDRVLRYDCDCESPDAIKKCLLNIADKFNYSTNLIVNAVRNKSGVYVSKGFIYSSPEFYAFLIRFINGKVFETTTQNNENVDNWCGDDVIGEPINTEDYLYIEDEYGIPIEFTLRPANVYDFGATNYKNKLFSRSIPSFVTEEYIKSIFINFTTVKSITTKNNDKITFPRVDIRKSKYSSTLTVSFEDNTFDAYFAYLFSRRLSLTNHQTGEEKIVMFEPCRLRTTLNKYKKK